MLIIGKIAENTEKIEKKWGKAVTFPIFIRLPYSVMKETQFRNEILPLKDKLFRLALRILLDRDEAEDVVQDTLLKLWERRDEWEQIQSMEAYCMTLCRNLSLDRSMAARRSNLRLNEEIDQPPLISSTIDVVDSRMRVEALRDFINELPEVQRSILLLRETEGRRYDEIAEILKLSEAQVKVYLHRARQRLQQQMKQLEQHGL